MSIGDTDFGVQVGFGFIGRVVTALVAFVGSIVLARIVGPSGYGTFFVIMAVVSMLDNPMTGWASACRKRLTEQEFPSEEAIGSLLIGIVLSTAAVALVALVSAPLLTRVTGRDDAWLFISLLYLAVVVYKLSHEVLKSTEKFGSSTWLEAGRDVVRVIGQVTLVVAGYGVTGMVGGMVVANVVVAPVVLYFIGIRPRLPSRAALSQIWSYARFSIPSGVLTTAQQRMDLLLLGFFTTTGVAGNYEVAIKLTMPAMFIAGVAQNGLLGRVSNLQSRGREIAVDVQNNLAYSSILGIPLFFGALVIAEPVIVTIYSSEYTQAATFLTGLALFRLLRSQKSILQATLNGLDRPELNLRISVVVFPLNLVLGLALLFEIGPIGVVIATVVSEMFGYLARAYKVRTLVPSVSLAPKPLLHQLISGVVMAIVVVGIRGVLPLGDWQYVALTVGLGGVAYFVTLVAISYEFRETIFAVVSDARTN